MTRTTPLRLTILHFGHILLTDDLTFTDINPIVYCSTIKVDNRLVYHISQALSALQARFW
jgi:hypothetical protein